jgi:hypothetical protein
MRQTMWAHAGDVVPGFEPEVWAVPKPAARLPIEDKVRAVLTVFTTRQ